MSEEGTPLQHAETFAHCFRGQANHLAMQFGGPLYLFGSMLTSHDPGDVDLRLCIEREDLACWFGDDNLDCTVPWGASSYIRTREELKQSRRMTRRWCRVKRVSRPWRWAPRIDFQFRISLMSESDGLPIFGDDTRPRMRLDDVPIAYFTAGRNEP